MPKCVFIAKLYHRISLDREVWKIIHRIIKPSYKPPHFDVEKLNKFFAEFSTRIISNCECTTLDQLNQIIEGLPERVPIDEQFTLKAVSRVDILNTIKSLKSDCSTGPDHIPVQFIKLAADQLANPLLTYFRSDSHSFYIITHYSILVPVGLSTCVSGYFMYLISLRQKLFQALICERR